MGLVVTPGLLSFCASLARHRLGIATFGDPRTLPEPSMKFVMLIHESPTAVAGRGQGPDHPYIAAWRAYHKALVEAGVFVGGAPLQLNDASTTVRLDQGRRRVQDGPFVEAKEQLGGFCILEVPDLDAALDWAARCPAAAYGAVEVRRVDEQSFDTIVAE